MFQNIFDYLSLMMLLYRLVTKGGGGEWNTREVGYVD